MSVTSNAQGNSPNRTQLCKISANNFQKLYFHTIIIQHIAKYFHQIWVLIKIYFLHIKRTNKIAFRQCINSFMLLNGLFHAEFQYKRRGFKRFPLAI